MNRGGAPASEPGDPDDRDLVDALRAGDPSAPGRLLDRYQGAVLGLCLRMLGHRHDAEDVVQETFLRALRGVRGFDGGRPLRPWLLGIAVNRCRTALVRRKRRPPPVEAAIDRVDPRPGLADPDDLAGELERALATLRPEYRMVFSLFHEQGVPYDEIARKLGVSLAKVKTDILRARAALAKILSRGATAHEKFNP